MNNFAHTNLQENSIVSSQQNAMSMFMEDDLESAYMPGTAESKNAEPIEKETEAAAVADQIQSAPQATQTATPQICHYRFKGGTGDSFDPDNKSSSATSGKKPSGFGKNGAPTYGFHNVEESTFFIDPNGLNISNYNFRIIRTRENSFDFNIGGSWLKDTAGVAPAGTADGPYANDVHLTPVLNASDGSYKIFSMDAPGISHATVAGWAAHPQVKNATEAVSSINFTEWVEFQPKAGGTWTKITPEERWHAIIYLTKDVAGNWNYENNKSALCTGHITVGTPNSY